MDIPRSLVRDLLELSASVDAGDGEVGARLAALVTAVRAAVPSYRGLHLTVHDNEQPVSLTSFATGADGDIATSLRLPFTALSPGSDSRDRVVFYASARGAFVDLAADLGYALHAPTTSDGHSHGPTRAAEDGGERGDGRLGDGWRPAGEGVIVLDADLPPQTLVSQLTGLEEVSTVNRAVGMLIDQGHHPDDAHATLRRHAAAAGVDTHIYAARLLRR